MVKRCTDVCELWTHSNETVLKNSNFSIIFTSWFVGSVARIVTKLVLNSTKIIPHVTVLGPGGNPCQRGICPSREESCNGNSAKNILKSNWNLFPMNESGHLGIYYNCSGFTLGELINTVFINKSKNLSWNEKNVVDSNRPKLNRHRGLNHMNSNKVKRLQKDFKIVISTNQIDAQILANQNGFSSARCSTKFIGTFFIFSIACRFLNCSGVNGVGEI